jgi:hypothetical protein
MRCAFFLNFAHLENAPTLFSVDSPLRWECKIETESLPTKFSGQNLRAGPLSEPGLPAFLSPCQVAVVAAVQEINGKADREPNDKPQPSIARQAEH